jgi:phage baseplate assembly protein W
MPVSKSFKDISPTFDKNFVTNDIIVTKDFAAIKNSIKNLLLTAPGERFFNPNIGSRISRLLFEPVDPFTANSLQTEIIETIEKFEPRVSLNEVSVVTTSDEQGYDVTVDFTVIGLPEQYQTIEFTLESTRA